MELCSICQELNGAHIKNGDNRYNDLISNGKNIIYQTEDLAVIPSLGPLNDSHVMIIPKLHHNSFAATSSALLIQAKSITEVLSSYIRKKHNKDLVFFESGAGSSCSHSGGCITHAHIHCIYSRPEFENRLFDEVELRKSKIGWHQDADKTHGYVWYMDSDGTPYICNNPNLPSQFLRYLYTISTGDIRFWNWRRHNNYEGILQVIDNYTEM